MTTSPAETSGIAPVVRAVHVRRDPEAAFRLFTEEIGAWWPMATHSVYGAEATVALEGDEVVERSAEGERTVWGHVLESDPPRLFAMTWHPGTDPSRPTTVYVRFGADGDGTRVELTHTGWETLGERSAQARTSYDVGWVAVLERLAAAG